LKKEKRKHLIQGEEAPTEKRSVSYGKEVCWLGKKKESPEKGKGEILPLVKGKRKYMSRKNA